MKLAGPPRPPRARSCCAGISLAAATIEGLPTNRATRALLPCDPHAPPTPAVAGISLAATIIESLPINQTVDDNLAVPGVAALLGSLAFRTSSLAAVAALF